MKKISSKIAGILLHIILTAIYFVGFALYFPIFKIKSLLKPNQESYWIASTFPEGESIESLKRQT